MFIIANYQDLKLVWDALTQYVDNQPELEDWETEAPEVTRARELRDEVEVTMLGVLEAA